MFERLCHPLRSSFGRCFCSASVFVFVFFSLSRTSRCFRTDEPSLCSIGLGIFLYRLLLSPPPLGVLHASTPLRHDLKCVRACLLIFSSLEASVAGLVARAVCVVIFVSVNISYVECCCHHHHPRMDLLPPASVSPVRSSPGFPYLFYFSHTAAAAACFWLQLLCKCSLISQHTQGHTSVAHSV